MFADLLFLMFASLLLVSALGVITAKNPMYCVLLLIAAFFNASGLFILMGAEFLGLLLVMVYVGAIMVMFLFVLMTINVDFAILKEGYASYLPAGLVVACVLLAEFVTAAMSGLFSGEVSASAPLIEGASNIQQFGNVLFTNYMLPFQASAIILLTAMIGAIVLTHRKREGVKKQNISHQIHKKVEDCVELKQVKPGEGI